MELLGRRITRFVAVYWVIASASAAFGAELWVDRDSRGGPCSDGYSRTQVSRSTPWCTLGRSGDGLLPGDVVRVREGLYATRHVCPSCNDNAVLQIINAGLPGAPIVYRPADGEHVTLSGVLGAPIGISILRTFDGRAPSWVEVEGFTIQDFPQECVYVRSVQNVTLRRLDVHDCTGSSVKMQDTQSVTLDRSFIHDNPLGGYTSAIDVFQCRTNNVLSRNFVWNNTDEHVNDSEGHGIIVDQCPGPSLTTIENNVIWGNEGACIVSYETSDVVVRSNTCYHNGGNEIGEIVLLGNRQRVFNNIMLPRHGILGLNIRERTNYRIDFTSTLEAGNLMWSPTHTVLVGWGTQSTSTVAGFPTAQPYGWGGAALGVDPRLRNPGGGDLRLQPGSLAIDSASTASVAITDVRGTTRGTAPDRGAYEVPAATTGLELLPEPAPTILLAGGVLWLRMLAWGRRSLGRARRQLPAGVSMS